jgi:hypothetical protein
MDKVSQLQSQLSQISFLFYNSIGRLQEVAEPLTSEEYLKIQNQTILQNITIQKDSEIDGVEPTNIREKAIFMGEQIIKACNEFDQLIDQLPGVELTEEEQLKEMSKLNVENENKSKELMECVNKNETMLMNVSEALKDITQTIKM